MRSRASTTRSRSTTTRRPSRSRRRFPERSYRCAERAPGPAEGRSPIALDTASVAVRRRVGRSAHAGFLAALARGQHLDRSVVGALVLAVTGLNLLWVGLDSRPPYWDAARHLGDSLVYRDAFSLAHPLRELTTYVYYPPFAYWVTDAFYVPFGTAAWVAILSQGVFLAVLAFATYGIGKTLWNRRVGLLATFFVVTTPLLTSLFKWYMLDPPLTAMVALALYLLIRSEFFSHRRHALAFGVVCGLGMLTKWTFVASLALPAAYALAAAARTAVSRRVAAPLVNAAGAGLVAFAIASVWYIHNFSQIQADSSRYNGRAATIEGDPPVRSLRSVLWYAWNLLDNQLYLVPFLFFLVGLVVVFVKNESAAKNVYPVLTIVGTYIGFTLLPNKDFRFTLPMLPAVAVIAVHWLEYVRPSLRRGLATAVVVYGAIAFLAVSFGTRLLPHDLTIHLKPRSYTSDLIAFMPGFNTEATRVQGITVFAQHGWLIGPARGEQWHQEDVFREIAARGGKTFLFTGPDSIWFNTWGTRYYALRYGRLTWVASPQQADFLIVRGPVPNGLSNGFVQIKDYALPDSETLRMFQRA